jgi:hypothetical protein
MRMRRALANARHADQEIEPIGEIGMGEASEMPFRCGGAQDGEEAFEFDGAALFETRDFRFDLGLEFGSLISFAGLVLPRAISSSICSIKVRCSGKVAKRRSHARFHPRQCKSQGALHQ